MNRIEVKSERRRSSVSKVNRSQRVRPTVMALEARTLLSTLTVNSTADDGSAGTLRWAIGQANASNVADTIVFSSLFNTPQTITLTGGSLLLTETATTTITGPGANLLSVNGDGKSRVFDIDGASAAISALTITGGSADEGGGLRNEGGTLSLTDATVSGNSATKEGGGLATLFGGTSTLIDCTVSGNTAPAGGGLSNASSTLTLTNSTLSGNTATGDGGGLYNTGGAATLTNVTISANSAVTGGGVSSTGTGATLKLTNTIVANQTAGGDVDGSSTGGNNVIGVSPGLSPLGDYGGPTLTMALLPGSPAIGQGASGSGVPTTDQRGFARGASVDIGAFQTQSGLVVNTAFGGGGSAADQLSLPQAVNLANVQSTADTISFSQAAFATPQTITLTAGQLSLTDKATTTINGPGAMLLSVSGDNASRVFDISGSATLSGLTITGGNADDGAGLQVEGGTATLTNCSVGGNAATVQGGGLDNFDGTLTLSGCTISNNMAPTGAGLRNDGGTLALSNSTISGNTASGQGGGFYIKLGTVALTNVTVSANTAATGGGLVNSGSTATVTVNNTILAGNTGGDVTGNYSGGNNLVNVNPMLGLLFDYGGPTFTMPALPGSPAIGGGAAGAGVPITDQRGFPRGVAVDIGAFQTQGTASMVVDVTTDDLGSGLGQLDLRQAINLANIQPGTNTVTFDKSVFGTKPQTITLTGGEIGLGSVGSPVIDGPGPNLLTINGNGASRVFVENGSSATLSGLTITGGSAPFGGGVAVYGGTLSLNNCTISGNSAARFGGGLRVSNGGTLSLNYCTIRLNSANQGGGGLENYSGTLALTDCTISGNSAASGGGVSVGAVPSYPGTTALTNCTVSGNVGFSAGGGLYTYRYSFSLVNCTVSGNSAPDGGGFRNYSSSVSITNTIVSGNTGGDADGSYTGSNNLIGGDPLLSPLGNYGGLTATVALLPGSPAIGGGTSGAGIPMSDERGVTRFGRVDIGAFQSLGFALVPVFGSTPQSAVAGTQFANPLTVMVRANDPGVPVDGGLIKFNVPVAGASAGLSAFTATIAGGQASVIATANSSLGQYFVTASVELATTVALVLTNTEAPSLVLTTASDVVDRTDGLTSLREAIAYANAHPGPDTITLAPGAFGKSRRTIVLTGGPLILTDPATTTIIGPGAKRLTISGGGKSEVFDIEGGSLDLSGVTVRGGAGDLGGGIRNEGGRLALSKVTIRGNRALVGGGLFNDGVAKLTDVIIQGNRALVGRDLFNTQRATLSWRRSPAGGRR